MSSSTQFSVRYSRSSSPYKKRSIQKTLNLVSDTISNFDQFSFEQSPGGSTPWHHALAEITAHE